MFNPLFPVLGLLVAWLLAALILRMGEPVPEAGRYASIDGLRGVLALLVFVHHGLVWYFYTHEGRWHDPASHLFTFFGQGSVEMFFMITGFLFFSKLLDRSKAIDWPGLYVSRLLRLVPLYVFAISLMFVMVAWVSRFELKVPLSTLLVGMAKWWLFTLGGAPDLNGIPQTFIMVAGVTWSLPFEWFYYAMLPLLALLLGRKVPARFLLLLVPAGIWFYFRNYAVLLSSVFLGGIAAACVVRLDAARRLAAGWPAGLLALACLAYAVHAYASPYQPVPIVLLSLAFTILACGNTLFGLLNNAPVRLLGSMSYGVYLLHGLMLYTAFEVVLGRAVAQTLSPLQHWLAVFGCAVWLVLLSYACFRLIEMPAMRHVQPLRNWLQARGAQASPRQAQI